ncbi:hypothetical protein ILYODFUR_016108 [Ilyodon furcidens]|uniref:Uncharacterized protein n=1 Tax=Ilyodon furcidens TaxID=33524 RepID=A0ABV0SMU4_9TELE
MARTNIHAVIRGMVPDTVLRLSRVTHPLLFLSIIKCFAQICRGRSQPWGGTAAAGETSGLTVGINSRKMLSWGEKGRESTERNRMEQGRVEQD